MKYLEQEFLKNKLNELEGQSKKFQRKCDELLENEDNILLCSPTGSGKTNRFLIWAIKKYLKSNCNKKIIITAPIKALSNQRFRELYLDGYNVGIETGDIKYNTEDCTFLCCTQEIATYKYINEEYITVIDEFHYIYNEASRSRTYIDYIINSKSPYIFLCSATLGNVDQIKDYIERISGKKYYIYNNKKRLTNLYYMDKIDLNNIKDAFVVSFSHDECVNNANTLRKTRIKMNKLKKSEEEVNIVLKTATKYDIKNNNLILNALSGIAYYYGAMLPKERLFVSELFSEKIIDTVFGTDALSLGVNFPIKNVVLTSLRKSNKLITKNLFDQLSGRAGRYGLYNAGYIYYCDSFDNNRTLRYDFETYKNAINEDVTVRITPNMQYILSGIRTIDEEICYVQEYSTEMIDTEKLRNEIQENLEIVKNFDIVNSFAQYHFNHVIYPKKYKLIYIDKITKEMLEEYKRKYGYINSTYNIEFFENIVSVYNNEYDALTNCILLRDIICERNLNEILFDALHTRNLKKNFRDLLQLRKYLNALPEKYRNKIDLVSLDNIISQIDKTVFDIEISFADNQLFEVYQSNELKKIISNEEKKRGIDRKVESGKAKIDRPKNEKNNKRDIVSKSIEKIYEEGTIIKQAGASLGSPKLLVLLYSSDYCILVNYNLYKIGTISISIESDLSKYFKIDALNNNEYRKTLLACKYSSETFLLNENSKSVEIKKIKKILNNIK